MKIACVGYYQSVGGAEKQLILLANALAERGHEVSLIVMADNVISYEVDKRVRIIDLSVGERNASKKIVYRFKALKAAYKKIKPDVSVHYWLQSAYLSVLMKKSIAGKVIYSERADPGDDEYKGMLGVVRKLAFVRIDGFIFQSQGARDYFNDSVKRRSTVIHNPVFIPKSKFPCPCKERIKKIVNVGRLHPQKNQKLLIEAFSRIADQFNDYVLEIFGDGELKEELEGLILKKKLQDRVLLKGTTSEIFDEVYSASLFVLSSDYEGMPNALLEALSLGVPCISTDCKPGGARSLIKNGKNGFLVRRNDPKSLAVRMSQVLSNGKLAQKFADEAYKLSDTHSPEAIFNEYEAYITGIGTRSAR